MSFIYIIITIIIGIMALIGNIGYGEMVGFASLLVTILIFYSNAINKQRKYNTEHELKIQEIYSSILEMKIQIKELDKHKVGSGMCEQMHKFSDKSIDEIKDSIKEMRLQITDNHNELLTKIK